MRVVPFAALAILSGPAVIAGFASIISTTGAVQVIAAPGSVQNGGLESNTALEAFAEKQNFLLTTPLSVDITTPGTYTTVASLTPGTIASGRVVNSYFVNHDSVGTTPNFLAGSLTFSANVLGVIVLDNTLRDSDFLGAPGTLYPVSSFGRGVDLSGGLEGVVLSPTGRTVTLFGISTTNLDQVRIITAVPEPGTLALFALGLAVTTIGFGRRYRRIRNRLVKLRT
jgi:hypothetical protein